MIDERIRKAAEELSGAIVGALCVVDTATRRLSPEDLDALR